MVTELETVTCRRLGSRRRRDDTRRISSTSAVWIIMTCDTVNSRVSRESVSKPVFPNKEPRCTMAHKHFSLNEFLCSGPDLGPAQTVLPNSAPSPAQICAPFTVFFSGSCGHFSCVTVHHYAYRRASLNTGKWRKKEARARAQALHLYRTEPPQL